MHRLVTWIGWLALALGGCSALVDADPDQVPRFDAEVGSDGGGGTTDGGGGTTDGGGSTCAGGCDDGVGCTIDECVAGICQHRPDPSRCGDGQRCHATRDCIPAGRCAIDDDCDDGLYCNGSERCAPDEPEADPSTGCVAGRPPTCGAPEGSCLVGVCDEAARGCTSRRDPSVCDDGNACTMDGCGPDDMCTSEPLDMDGDGYAAAEVGGMVCAAGDDCNDDDENIHPGAEDVCNGVDDDCDGEIDEDCPTAGTCDDVEPLRVAVGRRGTAYGTFRNRDYVARSFCSTDVRQPDGLFAIEVTGASAGQRVDIELDSSGSGADVRLAVDVDCGGFFSRVCHDDRIPGVDTDAKIWLHNWPADQRVWVLAERAAAGGPDDFRLNVAVRPAAADQCGMGLLDISGGGAVGGYIPGASGGMLPPVFGGRYSGSCGGHGAPEALARFDARYDRQRFDSYATRFNPALYVRDRCDEADAEVECLTGTWLRGVYWTRIYTDVDRGDTGYVFVDGGSGGDWYRLIYVPGDGP